MQKERQNSREREKKEEKEGEKFEWEGMKKERVYIGKIKPLYWRAVWSETDRPTEGLFGIGSWPSLSETVRSFIKKSFYQRTFFFSEDIF